MPLTVLVVAGGGFQGEALTQAIRAVPDARVVVIDSIEDNLGATFADRYLVAPAIAEASAFAAFLEKVIRTEQVNLVLPCSNLVLKTLASLRQRIEAAGALLGTPDEQLVDVLLDKQLTYEALLEAGIPAQHPLPLSADLLPLCGKPRHGWGGRDMHIVRDTQHLASLDTSVLAQSHCWVPWLAHFDEFSADFAIDAAGRLSPVTLRRRVRTSGGFAVISDSVQDASIERVMVQVTGWLTTRGGRGLFNVQVLRVDDDTLYVSDINPRHGTSSGHALAEGNLLVAFMLGLEHRPFARHIRTVRTLQHKTMPLPRRNRWRGVVFDLDDTLIDHKQWIMDKMLAAAPALISLVDADTLLRETYAIVEEGSYDRLIDTLAARLKLSHNHANLLAAYRNARPAKARLFPEVIDVLRSLRASGLRIGMLTDNPPASQRAKLDTIPEAVALFDSIVFSREDGAEKPNPGGFERIARNLQLPAETLLMVGDNVARDAIGAVMAGYDSCLLISREGSRYQPSPELFKRYWPQVQQRTWTATDLRILVSATCISPGL